MQAYPNDWDQVLADLYGKNLINEQENKKGITTGIVELNIRINFKFNWEKYRAKKQRDLPSECEVVRSDGSVFEGMKGSVIPY